VMIEAMACGTPVIVRRRGAAPEIVDHGVTGFLFESEPEAVAAVDAVRRLDRSTCRTSFESRFSATRMARDYVRIYQDVLAHRASGRLRRSRERSEVAGAVDQIMEEQ